MVKRNYKNVSINFNLDNESDKAIYEWLCSKRAKTAFIKDMLEDLMNNSAPVATINSNNNDLSSDDIDIDI